MSAALTIKLLALVLLASILNPLHTARASEQPETTAMSATRIAELMKEAKNHLIDERYARSIKIYTRLVEESAGDHQHIALEYLGVAREKNGQFAQAVADYRSYLTRFPDSADAERVQQRLAALLLRDTQVTQRKSVQQNDRRWRVFGGVTQDYFRAENKRQGADAVVAQSALLTFADLIVDRRGNRFDIHTRLNAGFQNDLMKDDVGPGDQGLVSNAYIEVLDQQLNWSARVGRQSLYTDGVLGRFDGLRASYRLRPNLTINLNAGAPVDSPRYFADSHRQFVGASVSLEAVADVLNVNLFTNLQRIDGAADREAIGGEIQVFRDRWSLSGMVDYDISYEVLNSALILGSLRLTDRVQLHGRVNLQALPYLTTRNALIGQSVSTVDALLDIYTEPQIRTLARDRTANAIVATTGLSATLSERWYFNGDVSYTSIEGTVASGGVEGRVDSGAQFYSNANFIGSSIFKGGDTAIIGVRVDSTKIANTTTLLFDLRFPFGRSFHVAPRLALSWREAGNQGDQQLIAAPTLRLTYRWQRRYQLELEAGGNISARNLPTPLLNTPLYPDKQERHASYYVNLRWGVNF